MLFNSFEFIFLFLPIAFIVYFYLNKQKLIIASKAWLVFCSLFFYGFWNIKYLFLILSSILFNFSVGTSLSSRQLDQKNKLSRKTILTFGILTNILLLAYYKYTNFFIININSLSGWEIPIQNIILPLGISFFTFTQIAYLVDAYKGEVKEMDYMNYSLFVTFFPHLIAGPILHHSEMMPQFDDLRKKFINHKTISMGIFLFFIGLFKKVMIADNLSPIVHQGFDVRDTLTFFEGWLTTLAYSFQLYFDFSGYTDMALGIAMMFNINLPKNFNSPYKAKSIQDFWRRWHITLSRFLRDYVYIPLGGNRKGEFQTCNNLLITFLIGGIWHGAGWTYIIWGLLHGFALVINRLWSKLNIKLHSFIAWFLTFNFVNIAWIFFRATSFNDAIKVLKSMFCLSGFVIPRTNKFLFKFSDEININWFILLIALIFVFCFKNSNELAKNFNPSKLYLFLLIIIGYLTIINLTQITEFLYFQF